MQENCRDPEKYGTITLKDLEKDLYAYSFELGIDIETYQSNHEGEIVEKIQQAKDTADGIVINAAAYTRTNVHMTNIHAREDFRKKSLISDVCTGQICGFGAESYKLALKGLSDILKQSNLK